MSRILYIGNSLIKHGFTPTGIDYLGDALASDYQITKLSDLKNPALRLLSMVFGVLKNARHTDLAIIDLYSTRAFWFAVISCRLLYFLKKPYILIARGGNLPYRFYRTTFIAKDIWSKAYARVAPSEYLASQLRKYGSEILVIRNHINVAQYEFRERKIINPNLIYVRALHRKYNPILAIKVIDFLRKKGVNAKLQFCGNDKDGSLQDCVNLVQQLNLDNYVHFNGKVSKERLKYLLNESDIFINTTTVDNTPISVLEGLAVGIPLVSTNIGGIPYLLHDRINSLLVESNNEEMFAEAILELLNDPELANSLSLNGRELAMSHDWSVVRESWVKLIQKLVSI